MSRGRAITIALVVFASTHCFRGDTTAFHLAPMLQHCVILALCRSDDAKIFQESVVVKFP